MSIQKLSDTVKARIVSRLNEVITGDLNTSPTQRVLNNFAEYASSAAIRTDTNTKLGKHESIMSRGGFELLIQDMRKAVEAKELDSMVGHVISTINFDSFIKSVAMTLKESEDYFDNAPSRDKNGFTYVGKSRASKDTEPIYIKKSGVDSDPQDVLIVKNLPHGRIVELFIEYVLKNADTTVDKNELSKVLYANLQGGHLTGVFTARLIRALGLQQDVHNNNAPIRFDRRSNAELTQLEQSLNQIVKLVTDADYLSSNIVYDVDLFVTTDKRLFTNTGEVRLTTEVQLKSSNEAAGDLLKTAGTYLSNLIKSVKPGISITGQEQAASKAFTKLLENLEGVNKYVLDRARKVAADKDRIANNPALQKKLESVLNNAETFETLINTEGSPSLVNHLVNIVGASLSNVAVEKSLSKVDLSSKAKSIKTKSEAISKKVSSSKQLTVKQPKPLAKLASSLPLTSLQTLINEALARKIQDNMGTGNSKALLNYRTGRLAESAVVERMSLSREGMITAFYNYMRNPYGTFSSGGAQAYPPSRDPKLLISKSIREIAATKVANRMRAILV